MGIRGIPANYGGFETFAENLSTRLVKRGHTVTVYCRSNSVQVETKDYQGVRLVVLPTISHKYLDTVAHTFLSVFHGLFKPYDVVFICNSVNSLFAFLPRLTGKKVVLNVDGLEWKRAKWNRAGEWAYRFSECLATVLPDQIVSDSMTIQNYYASRFKKHSTFIPYGAPSERVESTHILKKLGLSPRGYVLYVSRLEPENNAHCVVKAFERVRTEKKLVVVGDAPYSRTYIAGLKSTADPRILFTGYVFGEGYRELQSHAYCYIQATEVGGTHPALLEGMGYGNCVLANDVPEHREVLGDAGCYVRVRDIDVFSEVLQSLLDDPGAVMEFRRKAVERSREKYSWDRIVRDYEALFLKVI